LCPGCVSRFSSSSRPAIGNHLSASGQPRHLNGRAGGCAPATTVRLEWSGPIPWHLPQTRSTGTRQHSTRASSHRLEGPRFSGQIQRGNCAAPSLAQRTHRRPQESFVIHSLVPGPISIISLLQVPPFAQRNSGQTTPIPSPPASPPPHPPRRRKSSSPAARQHHRPILLLVPAHSNVDPEPAVPTASSFLSPSQKLKLPTSPSTSTKDTSNRHHDAQGGVPDPQLQYAISIPGHLPDCLVQLLTRLPSQASTDNGKNRAPSDPTLSFFPRSWRQPRDTTVPPYHRVTTGVAITSTDLPSIVPPSIIRLQQETP
jgi:hypothetical protein